MKLIRFGEVGNERPGIQLDEKRINVIDFVDDYDEKFFASDGLYRLNEWLKSNQDNCPTIPNDVRLGPPISRPSKLICVGLNYAKHAKEAGMDIPTEPVIFFKSTTAIVGPNDDVVIPKNSTKTDWEVELAIVIGKKASYVSKADADDYIAGYVLHNDISERAFQIEREGQWCKGKGCDTFAPLGPFLVTKDETGDPNDLELWLEVNGRRLQHSSTSDFVFDVQHVVSYISHYMTLLPGDVISTGTPFGVGLGFNPPIYLQPGDIMKLSVEKLGVSEQRAVAFESQMNR